MSGGGVGRGMGCGFVRVERGGAGLVGELFDGHVYRSRGHLQSLEGLGIKVETGSNL